MFWRVSRVRGWTLSFSVASPRAIQVFAEPKVKEASRSTRVILFFWEEAPEGDGAGDASESAAEDEDVCGHVGSLAFCF